MNRTIWWLIEIFGLNVWFPELFFCGNYSMLRSAEKVFFLCYWIQWTDCFLFNWLMISFLSHWSWKLPFSYITCSRYNDSSWAGIKWFIIESISLPLYWHYISPQYCVIISFLVCNMSGVFINIWYKLWIVILNWLTLLFTMYLNNTIISLFHRLS